MIKLSDLQYLGATTQVVGNYYYVTINGQTITFTKNSAYYSSTTTYSIIQPPSGSTTYTFTVAGLTEADGKAQEIDGVPYVRLTHAVHQSGALVIYYNTSENQSYVFHFRINSSTPYSDTNKYIVGGPWLTSWTTKGTKQLTPHFKVNEIWDDDGSGTYLNQLKISVASLQTEENIRYYHNNNSSINITSGFRSWTNNYNTPYADLRSLHMRGRAIDSTSYGTQSLYNNIYNEFKGTFSTPIDSDGIIWWSRVYGTSNSLSGAYELEKMPHNGSWWIHLGVKPQYSSYM